jgi:hypothetical protein
MKFLLFVRAPWFRNRRLSVVKCARHGSSRSLENRAFRPCAQFPGPPSSEDEDDNDGQPTELSRRVFSLTVVATGLLSFVQGFRLFADDDTKRITAAQAHRFFPFLFPREEEPSGLPSTRRAPLDTSFANYFFDMHAVVASELGIINRAQLADAEAKLLARSESLFFPKYAGKHDRNLIADPAVLNYKLYARIHAIAEKSSPLSRVDFSRELGRRCYNYIKKICKDNGNALPQPDTSRNNPRMHAADWLDAMRKILSTLIQIGWVSAYRISDFDATPGSLWQDEGRGELTVYCDDPVTLDTAMLIGEEHFEEISPKISSIIWSLLTEYGLAGVTFEDYYLDLMYRADPAAYQPRQIVTQFNFMSVE